MGLQCERVRSFAVHELWRLQRGCDWQALRRMVQSLYLLWHAALRRLRVLQQRSSSQIGASVNDVKIDATIYANEEEYLNFKVVDTGKSYVNDKFLNWADFDRLGYWKMTIQMKNQYSGINLLGLFADLSLEERQQRISALKQQLFDDGKITTPENYLCD